MKKKVPKGNGDVVLDRRFASFTYTKLKVVITANKNDLL